MDYINYFKKSVKESFESMFEDEIIFENDTLAPVCISSRGAAIIAGITGGKKGRVLLDMHIETAMKLAEKLDADLNDENFALFTIAEFCNIATGGATIMLNDKFKGVGLRLAPPSIFVGTNSRIYSPKLDATLLSYSTRFGKIDFYIGFEGEWI